MDVIGIGEGIERDAYLTVVESTELPTTAKKRASNLLQPEQDDHAKELHSLLFIKSSKPNSTTSNPYTDAVFQ